MTHAPPSAAHPLICHPASPCPLPLRIGVRLSAAVRDTVPGLLLHYEVQGDTRRLRLPASAAPGHADGLWQHTCLEAFVGVVGGSAYREFNFSPSGQWAAYRFGGPRQRDTAAEAAQGPVRPHIQLDLTPHRLSLQAWLPAQALPAPSAACDIGLTAVIETTDGQLSHWALQHPAARPDFHHRGGWQTLPALLPTDPTP